MSVLSNLFDKNQPLSSFFRPVNAYDFKKKVLSDMKVRCQRVTSHGTHPNNAAGDKDVLVVDRLALKLQTEMTELNDREEASHQEAEIWKAQKKAVLNALVPLPQPDIPVQCVRTQQSAAPCNPLSMLSGNIPNMPYLEEEMAEIVYQKPPMKQHLANNNVADVINTFNDGNNKFFIDHYQLC